jgi:hypothetical protein
MVCVSQRLLTFHRRCLSLQWTATVARLWFFRVCCSTPCWLFHCPLSNIGFVTYSRLIGRRRRVACSCGCCPCLCCPVSTNAARCQRVVLCSCFECCDLRVIAPRCNLLSRASRNSSKGAQVPFSKTCSPCCCIAVAARLASHGVGSHPQWSAGHRDSYVMAVIPVELQHWKHRRVCKEDCSHAVWPNSPSSPIAGRRARGTAARLHFPE